MQPVVQLFGPRETVFVGVVLFRRFDLLNRFIVTAQMQTWPTCVFSVDDSDDVEGFVRSAVALQRHAMGGGYRYCLLFNQDVQLFPDTVEQAVRFMEAHPACGVAGMKGLDEDDPDRIIHGGTASMYPSGVHLIGSVKNGDCAEPKRMLWVNGSANIFRVQCLRDVGCFDPNFHLYYQEGDYGLRCSERGWEVWYCPAAAYLDMTNGAGGKPNAKQAEYLARDKAYFEQKWANRPLMFGLTRDTAFPPEGQAAADFTKIPQL